MRLKIINYNILHGFHQTLAPYCLEKDRLASAQRLIALASPDILVLTEACYGTTNPFSRIIDYRRLFRFPYAAVARWGEYEWANAVLSKYPLRGKLIRLAERTGLRAEIQCSNVTLHVDVVHLPPMADEPLKANILQPLLKTRHTPYILAGDFNALSPLDNYDPTELRDGLGKLMGHSRAEHFVTQLMKKQCIDAVLKSGLKDTLGSASTARTFTVPTTSFGVTGGAKMRVDYIFVSPDITTHSAGVIRNRLADRASDHYPIYAVIVV